MTDAKENKAPERIWVKAPEINKANQRGHYSGGDAYYAIRPPIEYADTEYVRADLLADMTRQRDKARAEGFAAGLEAAVRVAEVNSQSNNPYISGLALRIANGIRALAEGAKP